MLISRKTFPLGFYKLVFSKHCDLDPKKSSILNFSIMNFQTVSLLALFVNIEENNIFFLKLSRGPIL